MAGLALAARAAELRRELVSRASVAARLRSELELRATETAALEAIANGHAARRAGARARTVRARAACARLRSALGEAEASVTCLAAEARPVGPKPTLKAAGTADLAVRVRAPRAASATDLVAPSALVKVRVLSARAAMLKAEATRRDRVKRELTQLVAAATYLRRALFALAAANRVAGALVAPPVPPPPSAARADPWPDSDGGDGDDSDDGGDGDDEDDATGEGGVGQSLARALARRPWRPDVLARARALEDAWEYQAWSPRNCWGCDGVRSDNMRWGGATASQLTPALRALVAVAAVEDERRGAVGRGLYADGPSAPTRAGWSVDDVAPLPGNAWAWVGGWRVDTDAARADADGWCYAETVDELAAGGGASAPGIAELDGARGLPENSPLRRLRRRRWVRMRVIARAPPAGNGEADGAESARRANLLLDLARREATSGVFAKKLSGQLLAIEARLAESDRCAARSPALDHALRGARERARLADRSLAALRAELRTTADAVRRGDTRPAHHAASDAAFAVLAAVDGDDSAIARKAPSAACGAPPVSPQDESSVAPETVSLASPESPPLNLNAATAACEHAIREADALLYEAVAGSGHLSGVAL